MSNDKIKVESYQNFGGINSKMSPYNTGAMEFLNITNFDFQMPGSLSTRWGSTQYVGQTFPGQITALREFSRLNGASYVIIGYSGGIYSGATTGQSQGLSLTNVSTFESLTNVYGAYNLYDNVKFATPQSDGLHVGNGSGLGQWYYQGLNTQLFISGQVAYTEQTQIQSANNFSFAALNDYLFMADGTKFLKFDGVTTTAIGLPIPIMQNVNAAAYFGGYTPSGCSFYIGASGYYSFAMSYVNSRGFESQIIPYMVISGVAGYSIFGTNNLVPIAGVYLPQAYGISSINIYSYWSSATLAVGNTANAVLNYSFAQNIPIANMLGYTLDGMGQSYAYFNFGTTAGNTPFLTMNSGQLPSTLTNTYFPLGFSLLISGGRVQNVLNSGGGGYYPQMLEVYKTRLFSAGYSAAPSLVWFSDAGEPEGYQLANNFEVRTNDADVVTALKAYLSQIYIFKRNSTHVLSGDNPNNFFLQEVSTVYGCVNFRSATVYDQYLIFLDRKGLVRFNGSSVEMVSNKIQPFFDRMNYNAAINTACCVHDKLRNQVLFAIPIDGSTVNNLTIVYDYLVNAMTTYNGYTPSVFAAIQGRNTTKNAFYGDTSGRVNWFGSSFGFDNGVGFTTYFKTRFMHDMGDSVQKQFRRQYINMDAQSVGTTLNINFFQDYGTSMVLQRSGTSAVVQQAFQNRIDFGISGKALAFELSNLSPASPLRIHGFTIESRMQRRV